MKPKRIQLKRTKGWKIPPNTVKVDRSTKWGNPFKIGPDGPDWLCVSKFAYKLGGNIFSFPCLTDIVNNLQGKNLACWCKIGSPCHADLLLFLANSSYAAIKRPK